MANNLEYKGLGSLLNGSEYNFIVNKLQSGTDSILTGSCTISGTTLKILSPAGIGSPTTWGKMMEAGSNVTSAGSNVWVVFGTAFGAAPYMTFSSNADGVAASFAGSQITAGSVNVISSAASKTFNWIAVGNVAN